MAQSERIDMRVAANVKQMAERATAVLGYASLTEYITRLIIDNAPKALEQASVIKLTNEQFNQFQKLCEDTERKPSERIMEAAKRLDNEGY